MSNVQVVKKTNVKKSVVTTSELIAKIKQLEARLKQQDEEFNKMKQQSGGRKLQVLNILKKGKTTVQKIADELHISARNVSSQMTYLRKDGIAIATDSLGQKFIEPDDVKPDDVKPDDVKPDDVKPISVEGLEEIDTPEVQY